MIVVVGANPVVTNVITSLLTSLLANWQPLIGLAAVYALLIMASEMGWGAMWRLVLRAAQIVGAPVEIDHGSGKLSEDAIVATLEEGRARVNRDTGDALWLESARLDTEYQATADDDWSADIKLLTPAEVTFDTWQGPEPVREVDEDEFIENWIREMARPERESDAA